MVDSVRKFDNLIKNKKRKTESRVQGSVQAAQLCSECTLQKKISLSVGLQLLWALPEPQEAHSHLIFASTALKGFKRDPTKEDKKRKPTLHCPDVQWCMPPLCSRKNTPFLSLSCWPSWQEKWLAVLKFAVGDYCHICLLQKTQWTARKRQQMLLKQSGRKSGHNPFPNPGGQLPGSGKHLCWGKRTTTGNLHACGVEEKAAVHTKFQDWWDTAGLRCRCWHKGLHNPAPSRRPVDAEKQRWLTPAQSPRRHNFAARSATPCENHVFLTQRTHFRGVVLFALIYLLLRCGREQTTKFPDETLGTKRQL